MFKGFYNLTSGMITHGRTLDVISNNMANVSTAGYKADSHVTTTFGEALWNRITKESGANARIGTQNYILASNDMHTSHTQGYLDETGIPLDFAIEGDAFFAIETEDGVAYTKAGNFMLDNDGYLYLPAHGRVLDGTGQPVLLVTDKVQADVFGNIYDEAGELLGTLGLYTFEDKELMEKRGDALFTTDEVPTNAEGVLVLNGWVERSNVDLVKEMADMISTQRAYQSAAQALKMYDQLMSKATNEVGRL